MSKRNKAETQARLAIVDTGAAPLGAALATLGSPKEAVAAIERHIAPITATTASNATTLASIARNINASFDKATVADGQAFDARVQAGKLLIEARERVDAAHSEHGTFAEWCKLHVKRSKADIYRCIKLARAPDPVQAREAEKAVARESVARSRAAEQAVVSEAAKIVAVSKLETSKPKPQASVWDKATSGLPASATRDAAVVAQSTALDSKTGSELASHIETQIRLLSDVRWTTISDARRAELVRLVRKMIDRIDPATNGA